MKRQKIEEGGVFRISLDGGRSAFGRILGDGYYAFYEVDTVLDPIEIDQIVQSPVMFVCEVADYAIKKGRWEIVGKVPLKEKISIPAFYRKAFGKDSYTIIKNGKEFPASRKECVGLELMAIWDAEQVEERILDYLEGRVNRFAAHYGPLSE